MTMTIVRTAPSAHHAWRSVANEARAIAQEAFVYLYPLLSMDLTRKQLTNLAPEFSPYGGPANAFTHVRAFPTADVRAVVRPNFDVLYSTAWLDLTAGPVVVSTADTGGRYFLMPMHDMWTDVFAAPGARTSGTGAASYAVVPPRWRGTLPRGVERIDAPTPYVWIIARTRANAEQDYEAVHEVQDGYRISLLSDWGKPSQWVEQRIDPSVDTKIEPLRQLNEMPAFEFFDYGAELMKLHPPHLTDWSMLARMKRIGLEPGRSFDTSRIGGQVLAQGAAAGLKLMQQKVPTLARVTNGWQMNSGTVGVYGNCYLERAVVAMVCLGASQPEDAIYPVNVADADGRPIVAENRYLLHFESDELPPAGAFWSLTLYDERGFPAANPIGRFAIGNRDALQYNRDGSLDLLIQHERPSAADESNWLPAPESGPLGLTLRLYAPKPAASDGRWNPPAIRRVG